MPLSEDCDNPAKKLPLLQQAEAILKDSGVKDKEIISSTWKAIFSWHFAHSESIMKDKAPAQKVKDEALAKKTTVKQITEAKINHGDYRYIIPVAIILVVLGAIYYFAVKNVSWDLKKDIWKIVMLFIAAIVTVVSNMLEIRVKRVDEVIAEYKEAYPEAAVIMNRDPWVMANRSWAIIIKYVSIVTVFMAALLAIK